MIDVIPPMLVPAFARIGLVLAHFVWQATVIAALLAIVLWLMRKRSANARYVTSVSALILMVVMPVATLLYVGREHAIGPTLIYAGPAATNRPIVNDYARFVDELPGVERVSMPSAETPSRTTGLIGTVSRMGMNDAFCAGAILWAAGVLLLAARLMVGWLGLHRLRRKNTEALPEPVASMVRQLRDRLGLRHVTVLATRAWNEPVAFGLLRPTVLVPLSVLTQCPPELIEALVAHELAHIRRYDLWVNLLQRITETLLFYHPAVWWVSGRIRLERELCCDDLAVRITNRRAEYATALVEIARLAHSRCAPALAAGVISPQLSMMERARRVLRMPATSSARPRVSYWIAGPLSLALAVTVGFVAMTWLTPSSAATNSATTQPTAVPQADLLRPAPETKTYVFSWQNASLEEMLSEFSKQAGLSVRGRFDQSETLQSQTVTYESVRPLPFDEALLLFNRLLEDKGYWVVRRDEFLDLKRITDFYRYIPPDHVYTALEAYRLARLPGWDVATVLYEPKVQPAPVLANLAMDSVPNNLARATVAFDGRRVELKGVVEYVNRQLDLLGRMDTGTPASLPQPNIVPSAPGSKIGPTRSGPNAKPQANVEVRSLAEGIVTQVRVRPGQEVKAGDVLAELDHDELAIDLEAVKTRLDSAKVALMNSVGGGTGEQRLREAVTMAELDLKRLELRLSRTSIRAPQAGRVTYALDNPGMKIAAGDLVAALEPASPPTTTQPVNRHTARESN